MQLERAVKAIFPASTSSLSFFIRSLTQGFKFGLLRSAIRYVGCLPMLLGTKAWAGSWRGIGGPPGTPVISPVVTHPTWFNEKSGGDAFCCATTSGASAAQTKPVRTPPARNLPLEKCLDIVSSSRVVCCCVKSDRHADGGRASFRRGFYPLPYPPHSAGERRMEISGDPFFCRQPQFTALRFRFKRGRDR